VTVVKHDDYILRTYVERLEQALEEISSHVTCHGPGCHYCDTGKHPPTFAAVIAQTALEPPKRTDELISVDGGPPIRRSVYEAMMKPYSPKDE
jgi:hypothetical protein